MYIHDIFLLIGSFGNMNPMKLAKKYQALSKAKLKQLACICICINFVFLKICKLTHTIEIFITTLLHYFLSGNLFSGCNQIYTRIYVIRYIKLCRVTLLDHAP